MTRFSPWPKLPDELFIEVLRHIHDILEIKSFIECFAMKAHLVVLVSDYSSTLRIKGVKSESIILFSVKSNRRRNWYLYRIIIMHNDYGLHRKRPYFVDEPLKFPLTRLINKNTHTTILESDKGDTELGDMFSPDVLRIVYEWAGKCGASREVRSLCEMDVPEVKVPSLTNTRVFRLAGSSVKSVKINCRHQVKGFYSEYVENFEVSFPVSQFTTSRPSLEDITFYGVLKRFVISYPGALFPVVNNVRILATSETSERKVIRNRTLVLQDRRECEVNEWSNTTENEEEFSAFIQRFGTLRLDGVDFALMGSFDLREIHTFTWYDPWFSKAPSPPWENQFNLCGASFCHINGHLGETLDQVRLFAPHLRTLSVDIVADNTDIISAFLEPTLKKTLSSMELSVTPLTRGVIPEMNKRMWASMSRQKLRYLKMSGVDTPLPDSDFGMWSGLCYCDVTLPRYYEGITLGSYEYARDTTGLKVSFSCPLPADAKLDIRFANAYFATDGGSMYPRWCLLSVDKGVSVTFNGRELDCQDEVPSDELYRHWRKKTFGSQFERVDVELPV